MAYALKNLWSKKSIFQIECRLDIVLRFGLKLNGIFLNKELTAHELYP
jgi:hypothetical protein